MNRLVFETDRYALFVSYVTDEYVRFEIQRVMLGSYFGSFGIPNLYGYRDPQPEKRNWRGRVIAHEKLSVYEAIQRGIVEVKRMTREAEEKEAREKEMQELVAATVAIEQEMGAAS